MINKKITHHQLNQFCFGLILCDTLIWIILRKKIWFFGINYPLILIIFHSFFSQVTNPSYLINYREIHHNHGLVTTSLGLQIPVDGRHFYDGLMRVRCVANLSPLLWQNGKDDQRFVQRRPALMDNREAMLLGRFNWTIYIFHWTGACGNMGKKGPKT